MHKLTLTALSAGLLFAQLPAQTAKDAIYYPFILGKGTSVTNLWAKGGLAPAMGTITSTNGTTVGSWVTGKTGSGLAGADSTSTYNYVLTGWKGKTSPITPLFSSKTFSWGFFLKQRTAPTSTSYFFSGVGSFRLFTGGIANNGLYMRVWGGTPADIILPRSTNTNGYDLQGEAAKRWVHVALTVDTGAGEAIWYIDGKPHLTIKVSGTAAPLPSTTQSEFRVNMHTSTGSASDYDIDDFRFTTRAVDPCEISRWAMAKQQCDKPSISLAAGGSQALSLDFGTPSAKRIYWVVGSVTGSTPGFKFGGLTVPLNYDFYTDITIGSRNTALFSKTFGSLDAMGKGAAALNVPKGLTQKILVGLKLNHACAVFDAKTLALVDVSNNTPLTLVK